MINNARELVNAEGFGTLQNMGRKLHNHKAICEECTIWIGLRPAVNDNNLNPLWDDEPDAQREDTLDLAWESVEVTAATLAGEETDRIVLKFFFEYSEFLDAVTLVEQWASEL